MISFQTDNAQLQAKHDAALAGLKRNVVRVYGYDRPVLIEGAEYPGIWLECGPLEAALYGALDPQVAFDSHRVFFRQQRQDGYLPCYIWFKELGAGQIQMVVPIAATAWEVYLQHGDGEFLEEAYAACSRWDAWLARYRNTRGRNLCEAFCEYDTGQDNSPRWQGLPHDCPGHDARVCAQAGALPYLSPDLSATVYGGRIALAQMAQALQRPGEAAQWQQRAEEIRRAILGYCFDPQDGAFYDLDRNERFVRIRGDAIARVLSEHVVDPALFDDIYRRQIHNPQAFWTPYPLPSIAADDPAFVRELPRNSWGGASQALTALRAPRWFEHYGQAADLRILMQQWVKALVAGPGFMQQINPWTGEFTPSADGYSPCMLVLVDFSARLHGIRRCVDRLEWNCVLPPGARNSRYTLQTPRGAAVLVLERDTAVLTLAGKELTRLTPPRCIVTGLNGEVIQSK